MRRAGLPDAVRRYFSRSSPKVVLHDTVRQQIERQGVSETMGNAKRLGPDLQKWTNASACVGLRTAVRPGFRATARTCAQREPGISEAPSTTSPPRPSDVELCVFTRERRQRPTPHESLLAESGNRLRARRAKRWTPPENPSGPVFASSPAISSKATSSLSAADRQRNSWPSFPTY